MARPNGSRKNVDMPPRVMQDQLEKIQAAAELMTNVGFIVSPIYGKQWASRALILYRKIMEYHMLLQRLARGERVAANGWGAAKAVELPEAFK